MFGYESVIGISAMFVNKRSLNRIYTQVEGSGFTCSVEAAKREFIRCGPFHELALRFVQAQLVTATQSAGCNAKHSMEQRLARWLLICADQTLTSDIKLSHDLMGDMLGSTRPTLSLTASTLRQEGLIDYTRGTVHITDRKGLEARACECYRIIKDHLDN